MAQNSLPRELGSELDGQDRKVGYFSWAISEYFLCVKRKKQRDIWCLELWKVAENINKYPFPDCSSLGFIEEFYKKKIKI